MSKFKYLFYGTQVYHVDLCTREFKAHVFASVPLCCRMAAICHAATGRNPEPIISQAVADRETFGYGKLYVMFLEYSKNQIAKAFAVLKDESNYPLLIHCIHGCARALKFVHSA
jgi:hypothetical protein